MPQEEKEKLADFILHNINLVDLQKEVEKLHKIILENC
jgi:dephospho-CoA kinase